MLKVALLSSGPLSLHTLALMQNTTTAFQERRCLVRLSLICDTEVFAG